ncbi:pyrroline-5-carboxylate reductase [Kordia sp. SMS9]|uniref:SDR family oxidoreductase n=1 Tax=Kordia sp. SMS9 TaxID=2282170 RepID=UPI000E0DA8E0|nr:SDR family oxidoreductase [Kordia sp. SMS9]AXG71759.1 pyrroline-5-carboxylate reductase [Kordia sp. SMS9]
MKKTQISILGCGWLGLALAKNFIAQHYKVKGSTTSQDKVATLQEAGIQPYVFTLGTTNDATLFADFLANSDVVVINFPPKRVADIVNMYQEQIRAILPFIKAEQKVVFVSSTSVYQNTNDWVSEELENHPEKESGKAVFAAENLLRSTLQNRLTILRFAGLFGYDRVPGRFLANKKELSNGNAPVNMIHQDDCIGLIMTVIKRKAWGEIINGCSDVHPLRKRFYVLAAKKLGLTPPEFKKEDSVSFKKVSNIKSKMLLHYTYKRPNPLVFVM